MGDVSEVCTVITEIMGADAYVGRDYGNWNGDRYVGFKAEVDDNTKQVVRVVSRPTALEAACELLASVRKDYPIKASLACRKAKCERGMEVYCAYVEGKTDAILIESAARRADTRSSPTLSDALDSVSVAAE